MLDIRNVKVNFDRSVEPYSIDIGMQHENGIVRLDFEFDEKFNLTNEYLYFMVTDDGRTLVYPIIDNSVVIGSEITQKKRYVANIVVSKNEIIDELNKNYIVWISKDVILTITANSIITGALSPEVLPVQLQIVYDDLFDLKADLINKLESGYFKGEKGDKGDKGDTGEQGAKGDKGDTEVTKENIKTALGQNPLIQPSTAQIGQTFKVQSINEDGTLGLEAVDMQNIDDIEGQISELKGDLGELDTRLSESINDITKNFEIVGISPNVVDMTKIKRGEYIHTNGQNASNEKYLHTDFIPVETGDKIESWRYTGSRWTQNSYNMRYVCAYGAEKNVMPASGAESQTLYTVPDNVKFIIISTDASWIDTKTQMILKNYDEIPTEFIDFSKGNYVAKSEFISEDVKENIAKRAVKTFDDLRINKGYFSIDGGSMEQPIEFPYHNVNARYRITFNAKVADMGTVSFVFKNGETEYARIDIDSADIKYYLDGVLKYTYSHGITIANTLQLILETNNNPSNIYRRYGLILTLKSNGQSFSTPAKGSDEIVVERLSKCDVKSISTTGTLSDAKAVWSFLNSQKYIYAFGDSYFSWSEKRWVYYLAEDGYADNLLTDAFTGRRSVEALESFKNVMKLGHPKYVFWCIGMNDRDTTVVNQNWLNAFEYVKSYCKENGIVLILATIPCVSNESYKNEPKNAVVRASGLRYIDFAKAVNAETEGSGWYEGMLDTDNVHPTALGAKTLYAQVLSDFPEICF